VREAFDLLVFCLLDGLIQPENLFAKTDKPIQTTTIEKPAMLIKTIALLFKK